jgi:hypothetical protein
MEKLTDEFKTFSAEHYYYRRLWSMDAEEFTSGARLLQCPHLKTITKFYIISNDLTKLGPN